MCTWLPSVRSALSRQTTGTEAELHEIVLTWYFEMLLSTAAPARCRFEFAGPDDAPDPGLELHAASASGSVSSAHPVRERRDGTGRPTTDDRMRWSSLESGQCRADISSARSAAR